MDTPQLPPNWRSARAADGKEYYFNELTGETSWTVPTVVKETPPEETAPAPLTTEPLGNDDKPDPVPLGGGSGPPVADGAGMAGDNMAGGVGMNDVSPDLLIRPNTSSFYESLGPGGFKLLLMLISSLVVLIESSILVNKLKIADGMVLPLDGSLVGGVNVTDAADGGRTVQDPSALARACKSAGSLAGLSLELVEQGLSADRDNTTYGVVLSTISFVFTLLFLALAKFRPEALARFSLPLPRNMGLLSAQQVFYGFLFIWWGPGTGVLTFHGPYRTTGNPYFACWAAFFASAMLCADAFTKMKVGMQSIKSASTSYLREMFGLLVSSVSLFFASIDFASHQTGAYGVSLGVISTVVTVAITYLIDKKKIGAAGAPIRKAVSAVLLILWSFAALILTFDSPFTSTGNGYFACWYGVISASLFVYREFFEMEVQWVEGRFQSSSVASREHGARQEMPVVSESLGA